ncbi:uncharacterized protein LOC100179272 [Ciona intestinalis]
MFAKTVFYIVATLLICTVVLATETTDTLDNGCTITRSSTEAEAGNITISDLIALWFTDPLPHLNCSGKGHKRLDVEGVVSDAKSLTVSYNDLVELQVDDLEEFTQLTKLELKMNKLVRISPSTTNLTISTLVFLSIAYNRLEVVPTDALKSFPNLRILILHSNQIHTIAPDAFKYNGKITHMSIGPNPVVDFNGEWMTGMNLMYLSLNSMGIRRIPEQFKAMTNLMWTNLASNKIRRINASTTLKLTELDTLYLANNEIEYIDKDAFKGAVKLRDIDLSDNRIQTLDKGTFKDMKGENLVLNLLENPLGCDCNTAWFKSWTDEVGAQNLATDIRYKCYQPARNHGKKPSQLTVDDFTCRPSDVIWEDCNQPQPIGRPSSTLLTTSTASTHLPDIEISCPSMCSCYDENGILYHSPASTSQSNDGGWGVYTPCPSLRVTMYVTLWVIIFGGIFSFFLCVADNLDNPLVTWVGAITVKCLETYLPTFTRMHWMSKSYPMVNCNTANLDRIPLGIRKDVKTLTLSGNHLKLLDVGEISHFPDLEKLDLKKNMIMTIRTSPAMMPKLTFLNLRLNNISGLSKTHLKSFPNLEMLTLQHNNITKIPNDLFKYNRKLIRLYIGPNPIKSFQSGWLGTLSLRNLALRNVSLTKIPSQLLSQKNLTFVDMSDNYITSIRNKTFSKLTKLKWLILENNRIATIQANAFNGATSLRMIDLSENNLKTLPGSVFSNISKERLNIELWENQFMCDCKMKDLKIWIEKMEALDPMADIRFKCQTPTRMHDQVSDQLTPEAFVCQDSDSDVVIGSICKTCPNPTGQIILAIVLTFIFTLLMGIIAWKCTFRRRYGDLLQYAKARNDNSYEEEF